MGYRRKSQFFDSAKKNTESYLRYYDRFKELSITSFIYPRMPSTVDIRFMENALFSNGKAVFFKDDVMGYLCLKVNTNGNFDVYGEPLNRKAFASNGYQVNLTRENSVIIYNNMLHSPSEADVRMMSERLSEYDSIIDVNIKAQKTPVLLLCDEDQELTIKNMYMRYDGNEPVIFGNKALDPSSIRTISTGAPYIADRVYDLKMKYWNEALTYLGIPNMTIEKKERMLTDEVNRAAGGTVASRFSRLDARRKAINQINEMFGLDIGVEFRDYDGQGENEEESEVEADE